MGRKIDLVFLNNDIVYDVLLNCFVSRKSYNDNYLFSRLYLV